MLLETGAAPVSIPSYQGCPYFSMGELCKILASFQSLLIRAVLTSSKQWLPPLPMGFQSLLIRAVLTSESLELLRSLQEFQSLLIRAVLTSSKNRCNGHRTRLTFQSLLIRAVLTSERPHRHFHRACFNPFLSGLSLLQVAVTVADVQRVSTPSYQGCPYFRRSRYEWWHLGFQSLLIRAVLTSRLADRNGVSPAFQSLLIRAVLTSGRY